MEIYLIVDGKRTDLTNEQLEMLGIDVNNDPFERRYNKYFYFIDYDGCIDRNTDNDASDNCCYNIANYCTDENLMKQRALHETLNRLLWRFSMQNGGDKIDWRNEFQNKWVINFNYSDNSFFVENKPQLRSFNPCFISKEIVERAIDEIIKPFMKEHPDFEW